MTGLRRSGMPLLTAGTVKRSCPAAMQVQLHHLILCGPGPLRRVLPLC